MRKPQRAIRFVVCGACLAAAQPVLSAELQSGFYLGLGAGESSFDLDGGELDVVVLDALFSQGMVVTSGSSSFEDSDTTLALFAGYRFNPYIGVEAGYIDLGAAEYRSTGTVNPPGPVFSAPSAVNVDVESTGFTLAALGSFPVGSVVDLHGRIGFFFAQTDLSVAVRVASASGSDTETLDSIGAFFGVGAGFNFGEHWTVSVDWTRYDNVGDEDEDDDVSTEAGFDVDALSLSAAFRF